MDPDGGGPLEVVVRRAEPGDAAALQATMAQPRAQGWTMQLPFPSVAEWQDRLDDPPEGFRLLVACVGAADGPIVGNLGLGQESRPRRRHVASIGMAVHDDWAGRGVGTALMEQAMALCDDWLQATRVELSVFTDNEAALALYDRFGFVVEGTQRGAVFRAGRYVDIHVMARLHPRLAADLQRDAHPSG